jgi:anti-sigma factor (TIGR02949 family)
MVNRSECEAVVRQLWPYLDGVISEPQRERFVRHLEECTDCTSHFEFARAFLDAVAAAAPRLDENDALRQRVVHALAAEGFVPSAGY